IYAIIFVIIGVQFFACVFKATNTRAIATKEKVSMAIEIERKFLVRNNNWQKSTHSSKRIIQGYCTAADDVAIRVRIVDKRRAFLTVKGKAEGISRHEFEYVIPLDDAMMMLPMCGDRVIEKTRHVFTDDVGLTWEV